MASRVNQKQLAAMLGVTEPMVSRYKKLGKIAPGPDGLYDAEETAELLRQNLHHKRGGSPRTGDAKASEDAVSAALPDADDGTLLETQRQHEWERVRKERLARKAREGQLVERDEILRGVGLLFATIKTRMRAVGAKVAPEVELQSAAVIQAAIDAEVDEALAVLSKWEPPRAA